MTRERRIAIEMWKYIRAQYSPEFNGIQEDRVVSLKREYLFNLYIQGQDHPYWAFYCWFCHYIGKRDRPGHRYDTSRCEKCPLRDCGDDSVYMRLCLAGSEEEWIEACDEIIRALGGTV